MRSVRLICILMIMAFSLPLICHADENETKNRIQQQEFAFTSSEVSTERALVKQLTKRVSLLTDNTTELCGITVDSYAPNGEENGSFTFTCELACGTSYTTVRKSGTILNGNASLSVSAATDTVFGGEDISLTAVCNGIAGEQYEWFVSHSQEKLGEAAGKTDDGALTIKSDRVGTWYYYCIYGGVMSNIVKVETLLPFVPVTDITLEGNELTCGVSSRLTPVIHPENATAKTVQWDILSGNATLNNGIITPKSEGELTIRATVKGGGEGKGDLTRIFTVFAVKNSQAEKDQTKRIDTPSIPDISSITVTGKNIQSVQITSLSPITAKRILSMADISEEYAPVASAYVVTGDDVEISSMNINIGTEHSHKTVGVVYENKNGQIITLSSTVMQNGDVSVPADGVQYIITSEKEFIFDPSLLLFALPLLPVILVIIFRRISRKYENEQ